MEVFMTNPVDILEALEGFIASSDIGKIFQAINAMHNGDKVIRAASINDYIPTLQDPPADIQSVGDMKDGDISDHVFCRYRLCGPNVSLSN
jgi:hypothetical protein